MGRQEKLLSYGETSQSDEQAPSGGGHALVWMPTLHCTTSDRVVLWETNRTTRVVLIFVMSLVVMSACMIGPALAQDISVPDILERVTAQTILPDGIQFTQSVDLRALFFRWKFESEMVMQDGVLQVTTRGAPGFVPESLPGELVELARTLSLFDVEIVREDSGEGVVVVTGPRPEYDGRGAREATFWIDIENGVVFKAEAVYSWGSLHVNQEYMEQRDYLLLRRQTAEALGFKLEVLYHDYALP